MSTSKDQASALDRAYGEARTEPRSKMSTRKERPPSSLAHIERGISNLRTKREEVCRELEAEQAVHNKLREELAALNDRLAKSEANLQVLQQSRDAYTATIEETTAVYHKIEESSQNLLAAIKREGKKIQKGLNEKKAT